MQVVSVTISSAENYMFIQAGLRKFTFFLIFIIYIHIYYKKVYNIFRYFASKSLTFKKTEFPQVFHYRLVSL